ncbi:hypothetical protein BMETH_879_1 [methanotrophic bacterial endosymbiont of Bathymodiolus sp.]|nr:hypothetical protein BMETH_879_1 [methanotrophic bacterial endosymbiont of Bathymodiolus sp.]
MVRSASLTGIVKYKLTGFFKFIRSEIAKSDSRILLAITGSR